MSFAFVVLLTAGVIVVACRCIAAAESRMNSADIYAKETARREHEMANNAMNHMMCFHSAAQRMYSHTERMQELEHQIAQNDFDRTRGAQYVADHAARSDDAMYSPDPPPEMTRTVLGD